jgi:hypothetical protein
MVREMHSVAPMLASAITILALSSEPAAAKANDVKRTTGKALLMTGGVAELPAFATGFAIVGSVAAGLLLLCPFGAAILEDLTYGGCAEKMFAWGAEATEKAATHPLVFGPAIAGAVMMISGGVLVASSGRPRAGADVPAARSTPAPEWRVATVPAGAPKGATIPLLRFSF